MLSSSKNAKWRGPYRTNLKSIKITLLFYNIVKKQTSFMVYVLVIRLSSYHSKRNVYESFIDAKIASQFHILVTLFWERDVHNVLVEWLTKAQETILIQLHTCLFYGIIEIPPSGVGVYRVDIFCEVLVIFPSTLRVSGNITKSSQRISTLYTPPPRGVFL